MSIARIPLNCVAHHRLDITRVSIARIPLNCVAYHRRDITRITPFLLLRVVDISARATRDLHSATRRGGIPVAVRSFNSNLSTF